MTNRKKGIFRSVKQAFLRGNSYIVQWAKPRVTKKRGPSRGLCDCPSAENRKIVIDPTVSEPVLLDTIIHEALHGCVWDLDEESVESTASSIADLLWACGYRRLENPEENKNHDNRE